MITLANGSKWRTSEKDAAETTHEQFIDALRIDFDHRKKESSDFLWPERWDEAKQYWNNDIRWSAILDECFMLIASKASVLPFGVQIFVMPWGKVYASYMGVDSGGQDGTYFLTHFNSWDEYLSVVTNVAELPQDQDGDE